MYPEIQFDLKIVNISQNAEKSKSESIFQIKTVDNNIVFI